MIAKNFCFIYFFIEHYFLLIYYFLFAIVTINLYKVVYFRLNSLFNNQK